MNKKYGDNSLTDNERVYLSVLFRELNQKLKSRELKERLVNKSKFNLKYK